MPYCPNCGHEVDITARFCENCGEMLPVVSIPNIPQPSIVKKKPRHTGLILFLIVVTISLSIILYEFLLPKDLVTEPLSELLPTRYDLSSEWVIGNTSTMTININGFNEGIKLELYKTGLEIESAVINVFRFDSLDSARVYFDSVVSDQKTIGGYEEVTTNIGDKSYGVFQEFPTETKIYVIRMNIYYEVSLVSSLSTETRDDAIQLADIIDRKIH